MMQATTLGNLFRRAGNQRTCFWVTSLGNAKVTNMGKGFLLVLAVYYDDGFHGRRDGCLVTTLGITGFCMIFDLVLACVFFLGDVLFCE